MTDVFHADLAPFMSLAPNEEALKKLRWKDFGGGTQMASIAREGKTGAVFYRLNAPEEGAEFTPHHHPGGEFYLVLKGCVEDEFGRYPAGSMVWLGPESTHAPRGIGDTLIMVFWPAGIESRPASG